jgi:hypothetical protein
VNKDKLKLQHKPPTATHIPYSMLEYVNQLQSISIGHPYHFS